MDLDLSVFSLLKEFKKSLELYFTIKSPQQGFSFFEKENHFLIKGQTWFHKNRNSIKLVLGFVVGFGAVVWLTEKDYIGSMDVKYGNHEIELSDS